MPHPTLARHVWRAALTLALAASLSAACGDPKPPPTPDPPQVALTVPKPTVAGTSLKVIVNVTGCDTVSTLNLYDRETLLKAFTYGGEDTTLELLSADIPYATLGLAAYLSLNAEAVCQDGRRNKSQPQPATFLPVSRVVEAPANGRPVVTDFFVVDGSSTSATFIGCGVPSTGLPTLYKVDATGRVTADPKPMPFACTAETVMTERNAISGKRWLWTPGVGACAVDANLNITGRTAEDLRPTMLSVLPDGDAIIVNRIDEVRRLSHMPDATTQTIATVKWLYTSPSLEGVLAPPLIRSDGIIKLVTLGPGPTAVLANVVVDDLNANGIPDEQNRIYSQRQYTLRTVSRNEPLPLAAFNADGTRLYLGMPLANNQSHVITCVANPAGTQTCEGPNNLWTSAALPVPLARVYFHPESSRVLAIGRQRVWFLDAASGAIRTWESRSLDANGALNVLQVLPGRGSELFLLNAPPRGSLEPPTVPHEIVAVDQSPSGEARELFRHQVSSSLSGAVDAEGRLWLRVGPDLAQALPMGEYRRYRP
jgi:hypothetical protein